MNKKQNEGYDVIEEDKNVKSTVDKENEIKEDKKSNLDPIENQTKVSNPNISSEKKEPVKENKETLKETDNDKLDNILEEENDNDDLESMFGDVEKEEIKEEEEYAYGSDAISFQDKLSELMDRYLGENNIF